jgi:hypothetical protein
VSIGFTSLSFGNPHRFIAVCAVPVGVLFSTPPCCPPTEAGWHRLCIFNPGKKLEFIMGLLSYIMVFVTGMAVGFVFSVIMLFRKRLDRIP